MSTKEKVLVSIGEACERLNVSWWSFNKHVRADLPVVRIGALKRYRIEDLERWAERNARS